MPNTAPIRSAVATDLPELQRLEAQFPGDRLSRRQLRYHLARPGRVLRVQPAAGGLAGYALLLLPAGRPARLYSIVVDSAARGAGIGARLLRDAEACARGMGADRLRLEVRADNAAAQALYRAAGYELFGVHRTYYDDGGDALRFERALDDHG